MTIFKDKRNNVLYNVWESRWHYYGQKKSKPYNRPGKECIIEENVFQKYFVPVAKI